MRIQYTHTYIIRIIIKSIIKKYAFSLKRFKNELVFKSQAQSSLRLHD